MKNRNYDKKIHKFNVENPYETLLYYYTLRCNVVHRGKAMFNDFSMLEKATEELLDIFKDILKDTFGESIRYFDKRYKKI